MESFYVTTAAALRDPHDVKLLDPSGLCFGTLSWQFLIRNKKQQLNNGVYLYSVAHSIAEFPENVSIVMMPSRQIITPQSKISPGTYQVQCAAPDFAFAIGPAAKSSFRVGAPSGSTVSHSSRSTKGQSSFRRILKKRDKKCQLSGIPRAPTQACHIVPFSAGPEYLRKVVHPGRLCEGYDEEYHPENGLLIARFLHADFDSYNLGIYLDDDDITGTVHVFSSTEPFLSYHGRTILFRSDTIPAPNARVTRWHYSQCLMKNVRGFDVEFGMEQETSHDTSDVDEGDD